MPKPSHQSMAQILETYRAYLLSKVSKVRVLGETAERELKAVFVELSIVERSPVLPSAQLVGLIDSGWHRPRNPFSYPDRDQLQLLGQGAQQVIPPLKVDELLRRRTKAIVSGAPGCGKTTLLKYVALQAQEREEYLAVWVELKALDKSLFAQAESSAAIGGHLILQELWLNYLKSQLFLNDAEIKLLRQHWEGKFRANKVVVLLDGFDELQDESVQRSLNKCLREFASALHSNALLISTRPYAEHKLGHEGYQELEIEGFNQRQIEEFLDCYYPGDAAAKSLLRILRERSSLRELLRVPMLLGVILRLHRENRFTDEKLKLYKRIIADLNQELDRSKSVVRGFQINDERLRLDFLKYLAFELLLRDSYDDEGQELNRIAFSYDVLKEKGRVFLAHEGSSHRARDLANDALATPLLREVGTDKFSFTHLVLQEYMAAIAFAAFYKDNESEGLQIFCRAYRNPTIAELEVLPMALGELPNADKVYAEIENWPESLTFTGLRLRARGLAYSTTISHKRLSALIDRLLEFVTWKFADDSPYREIVVASFIGLGQRAIDLMEHKAAELISVDNPLFFRSAADLGLLGSKKTTDSLIRALRHNTGFVRWNAAELLGQIDLDLAVTAIADTLNSQDDLADSPCVPFIGMFDSQFASASFIAETLPDNIGVTTPEPRLGKMAVSGRSVESLVGALNDKYFNVRSNAAESLAQLRLKTIRNGLLRTLTGVDTFARKKAAVVIAYYRVDKPVVEQLMKLSLVDKDHAVRKAAQDASEKLARMLEILGPSIIELTAQPLLDNESRELFLLGEVFRIAAAAGHIFRPTANSDWGIDGEIEFKNNRGQASGRRVYLQLKSGDSYLRTRKCDGKELFSIRSRHAEYWCSHAYPVLLVIRNSAGHIRWMNITEYLQRHGTRVKQVEFQGESFTVDAVKHMRTRFARSL
jgi:hypothetical protein